MSRIAEQVREFHEVYGCDIAENLTTGSIDLRILRNDLLLEEVEEFTEASALYYDDPQPEPDIVGMADALGDIVYVAYGAAVAFGIDLDVVLDEIHRSNMSKLGEDGKPIYRVDGKILKGPNYFEPQIARVLAG